MILIKIHSPIIQNLLGLGIYLQIYENYGFLNHIAI